LIVERTDFISVPVTDMERSKRFYGETLGLQEIPHPEQGFPEYQLGENVSLYLLKMENIGAEFTAPHTASIALRVPDVDEARQELMAKGIEFYNGETFDTGVCHMAHFRDPDGNVFMLHRRYAP
jgi:catechol 2,3-dioxygenase-like lactoylglutathione lyase family enzyme